MNRTNLALFSLVTLICAGAQAGPGGDAFEQYVDSFTTLKAHFIQTVYNGSDLDISEGEVFLARPDQFRWDYSLPYTQAIISDGAELWIYDQDLDQVTRVSLEKSPENTPMLRLGGGEDPAFHFELEELGHHGELDWLLLAPKQAERQYAGIRLGFDAEGLRIMELEDNLGQTTRLQFSDEQRNPVLPPGLFEFEPPPGVDVVEAFGGE